MNRAWIWPWLISASLLSAWSCAALSDAEKAGMALCKINQASRDPVAVALCDTVKGAGDWITVASLAAAKPDVSAAKQALADNPPLSLMAPCTCPIDTKDPYPDGGTAPVATDAGVAHE